MESPPNWVKERADCNLDMVFEALFSVADRDVAEVNRVSSLTKNGVSFAVQREDGGMLPTFRVDRKKGGKSVEHVSFQKDQYQIAIVRSLGDGFSVRAKWDYQGQCCKLLVQDVPHEVWQVSMAALEPLFFRPQHE